MRGRAVIQLLWSGRRGEKNDRVVDMNRNNDRLGFCQRPMFRAPVHSDDHGKDDAEKEGDSDAKHGKTKQEKVDDEARQKKTRQRSEQVTA